MKNCFCTFFILFFLAINPIFAQQKQGALSEKIFQNPPSTYGIRCWWWWLNGNVTKEAITRDLTEMKAKGFSGACIFDAGGQDQRGNGTVPEGPLWGSDAWRELYLHAIKEAKRLSLVMSLSIQSGWNLGGPDVSPEEAAKQTTFSEIKVKGGTTLKIALPMPRIRDDYYKDVLVLAIPDKKLTNRIPIRDFANKAATREVGWSVPETRPLLTDTTATEGEEDATLNQVINLTPQYKNGFLEWNAPEGDWVILRMGYTPTESHVSTSSGKWQGKVLDYMSEKHFNRYWDTHVEPLLKMIGDMAGKTLRYLQTDSFEAGGLNWTDGFEKEFIKRRGYDPLPYLPILAGKIIENRDISNRFLSDFRKTISDCISENHYRVFAERAKKFGIGIQPESAGPHAGPFDGLKNYSHSEIMMSEFWSPSPHRSKHIDRFFVKQAASAAKIFNKKLVGAESFTTIGPHWNDTIWSNMKPSADHEFCAGLNLVYLHTFTCSPKEMGLPGQEYFAGTHFNPNVTWWNESTGFIQYLTRVQYLMQQGTAVADVLSYYGDHIPNLGRYKEDDPAGTLPDYDYDLINEDRLLDLSVKNGKIMLPHGVSYRVLALPNHKILSLAALKKVKALITEGATVIGLKPYTTASLVGFPQSEKERETTNAQLWGTTETTTGEQKLGQGRMIWGKTAKEVLNTEGLKADCIFSEKQPSTSYDYLHRELPEADYYFISSQNREATTVTAAFRMTDKQPELWDAVTGEIRPTTSFYQKNGQTYVPLSFNPFGSIFVVFRKPFSNINKLLENQMPNLNVVKLPSVLQTNFAKFQAIDSVKTAWTVKFDPKWGGSTIKMDKLQSWTDRPEEGIKYYSGKAVYTTSFNVKNIKGDLSLDLGEIKDIGIARVKMNGKDLGIVWCPPYRVNISGILKKRGNQLEVEVVNTWRNRLVGDRGKPQSERFTQTNITITPAWTVLPSGLLGPVRLLQKQ
jgi:hypothetical protein